MAELVAKTSTAVAVDEDLTALIDWTNIEQVSGFTIVINNNGGGSADDIIDVQIDTSGDGGTTSSLDQHPAVPLVPIAASLAAVGTFTETAKFIRIRAKCDTGKDTTVSAILLADSGLGRLCTLNDIKQRLGKTDTADDELFNQIILGIESLFDDYTGRRLIQPTVAVTECYTGEGAYLQLQRYPVILISSIKEALDYDFDSIDALVANSDYRILKDGLKGILWRILGKWSTVPGSIQIIYRGGYCPAGQTPAENETAVPSDLREAAILQACFLFKRKDDLGLSSVSFQGGSVSKFADIELLPMVKQVLDSYKKIY